MRSGSVLGEALVVLAPSSKDAGEVAVDEESPDPVGVEPASALRDALVIGDRAAKVDAGGLLELGDSVVSLLELVVGASEFGISATDDVPSVDEGAGNDDGEDPDEKGVLSALLRAGNEGVEEGKSHEDSDGELWPEELEVVWIIDGVGSTADGTEDHEESEEFDSAFDWEAEAAVFSHVWLSFK